MDERSGDAPAAKTASRRRFLLQGAALGTALAAPGLLALPMSRSGAMGAGAHGSGGANSIGVPRATNVKHAPLVQPETRRSANGVLATTLRVGYAYKDIGGYRLSLRTYE